MKRLFSVIALVCAASIVQAGAITWSAASIQASPSGAYIPTVTTYAAYLYVVSSSVTLDIITGYLNAGKVNEAANASSTMKANPATESGVMKFMNTPAYGNYVSQTVNAFMIVADAATMADANNYLIMLENGSGDAVLSREFGPQYDRSFNWNSQESNTNWQEIGAVPEPFSGALVLLGLAGIGLKRKFRKQKKA